MSTTRKIAVGLGIASGALLAAWLLTGNRKKKTKEYISKKADGLKNAIKTEKKRSFDDSDAHYLIKTDLAIPTRSSYTILKNA
jgi:hypothetical protein